MCGILGTYNWKIDYDKFLLCLDRLKHRGPNGCGYWENGAVQFGHTRLSIIDLTSTGAQPMVYGDGKYVITYNGEIYNYIEIRNELKSLGFSFEGTSDTEVLLVSYIKWGKKCLDKLNGMFAFAIWDESKGEIFLARDRFGVKPLYYTVGNGEKKAIAFSSEMRALIPLIEKPTCNTSLLMNKKRILTYEGTDECLINEVKRFPAGHYAIITQKEMRIEKWWSTVDNIIDVPENYDEQVDMLRSMFLSSCKLRTRSDVHIGTALSGGVDSSAVLSTLKYLSELCGENGINKAYVATFSNTAIDERYYAAKVLEYNKVPHMYVEIDPRCFWENISEDVYLFEDIYITPSYPMMQLYSNMQMDNTVVTLDGHGADELFCGYDTSIQRAFLDVGININEIKSIAETYLGLFSDEHQNLYNGNKKWKKMYCEYVLSYFKSEMRHFDYEKRCIIEKMGHLNALLYEQTHRTVLPTLLRNYDRYSMSSGVEIRMPFLDYRIVEFAFSLRWNSKIRNGYTKAIVRDAMRGIMPQEIIERRPKIGFSSPLLEWFSGPLKESLQDFVASSEVKQSPLLNSEELEKKLEKVLCKTRTTQLDAEQIWMEIQPFLWEKHYWKRVVR